MNNATLRNTIASLSLLTLVACGGDDVASFDFGLRGDQEVPAVETNATGQGTARLENDTLTLQGSFEGLGSDLLAIEGSPAHIHQAPAGENGPIVFVVDVTPNADNRSGTFQGTFALTETQAQAFRDGLFYLNIHTESFPAGELRGQLEP